MGQLLKAHQPCNNCGSSDALAVFDNGEYCYSCGTNTRKQTSVFSSNPPKELPPLALPEDCSNVFPDSAIRWLVRCGLSELVEKYQIRYSKIWNRVIIPSYFRGQFLGWQGRAIEEGQSPKYIQGAGQKPSIFCYKEDFGKEIPFVVVVEDAASAMCLGEYVPTVALLGTSLDQSGKQIEQLTSIHTRFIIALDSDGPGRTAAIKLEKRLDLVGTVLTSIVNPKDWKYIPKDDLKKISNLLYKEYAANEHTFNRT